MQLKWVNISGIPGRSVLFLTNQVTFKIATMKLNFLKVTVLFTFTFSQGYAQLQVVDADNGITASGSGATRKVSLGGSLTNNTTINFASFNLLYDGTGNIGIRTTNPFAPLHVAKNVSGNFNPVAIFEDALANGYTMIQLRGTGRRFHLGVGNASETTFGLANKFFIWDDDDGAARLVVAPTTGNIGIGTSNPATKLHVHGTFTLTHPTFTSTITMEHINNNVVRFNSSVIGEFMRIGATNTVDFAGQGLRAATRGAYLSNTAGGYALETVAGNVRLNATSGNTLIGTGTDNGSKLQVNGDLALVSAQPHIIGQRYSILIGDEGGGSFLFYGDNTARDISIGTAHGNNFHKIHFQKAGSPGEDVAAYNFTYNTNTPTTHAMQIFAWPGGTTKLLVSSAGNLIINNGTTDNGEKLQVKGNTWTEGIIMPTNAGAGKVLTSNASGVASWQTPSGGGGNFWPILIPSSTKQIGNTGNENLQIITNNTAQIHIAATGEVGIGTVDVAPAYKLSVQGSIRARKIRVDAAAWPDYVFHPTYRLRPLQEVEQFIKNNSHLPDVPSAAEVEKEGIDLGDNQGVLLKKIEELTLYIIAQNKRLEEQDKRISELEKRAKQKQ